MKKMLVLLLLCISPLAFAISDEDKEIVRKFLISLKEKQQDAKQPVGLPPKEN